MSRSFGVIRCASEKRDLTQKGLIVERNGSKFGPRRVYAACILVFVTLNMSRSPVAPCSVYPGCICSIEELRRCCCVQACRGVKICKVLWVRSRMMHYIRTAYYHYYYYGKLWSLGALFRKWGVTLKRPLVERNGRTFGPRECSMHMCTFDLKHVKIILGSFDAFFQNWAQRPHVGDTSWSLRTRSLLFSVWYWYS